MALFSVLLCYEDYDLVVADHDRLSILYGLIYTLLVVGLVSYLQDFRRSYNAFSIYFPIFFSPALLENWKIEKLENREILNPESSLLVDDIGFLKHRETKKR